MYGHSIPFQTFLGQKIKGVRRISTDVYEGGLSQQSWQPNCFCWGYLPAHLIPQRVIWLRNFSYNIIYQIIPNTSCVVKITPQKWIKSDASWHIHEGIWFLFSQPSQIRSDSTPGFGTREVERAGRVGAIGDGFGGKLSKEVVVFLRVTLCIFAMYKHLEITCHPSWKWLVQLDFSFFQVMQQKEISEPYGPMERLSATLVFCFCFHKSVEILAKHSHLNGKKGYRYRRQLWVTVELFTRTGPTKCSRAAG